MVLPWMVHRRMFLDKIKPISDPRYLKAIGFVWANFLTHATHGVQQSFTSQMIKTCLLYSRFPSIFSVWIDISSEFVAGEAFKQSISNLGHTTEEGFSCIVHTVFCLCGVSFSVILDLCMNSHCLFHQRLCWRLAWRAAYWQQPVCLQPEYWQRR